MKKTISIFLCIAILISLCSCTVPFGNAVFSIGTEDSISNLDPIYAQTQAERMVSTNCFEGLLRFDAEGNITLAGATAYTIEKHGLSYVFKLNPNAQWYVSNEAKELLKATGISDFDNTITAYDYVFGFKCFGAVSTELDTIEKLNATSDFTLEISLNREDADFLYKLASLPIYPCSETFYNAAAGNYASSPSTLLYNGPYFIRQQEKNILTITKNPDYNGNIQIKNKEVSVYTDIEKDVLESSFRNNTHNLYIADSSDNNPSGLEASSVSFNSVWGFAFNCQSKLGSSESFRSVLFSTISATDVFTLPAFATEKATTVFPPTFTVNDVSIKNSDYEAVFRAYNEEKALLTLNTLQKKYNISSYSVSFAAPYDLKVLAEKMVKDWKTLFGESINITINLFNRQDAQAIADAGNYDIAILPVTAERNTAYSLFSSLFVAPCYCSISEITSLVGNLGTIANDNLTSYFKTEKYLSESCVFIPLFYTGKALYINDDYKGVYLADGGNLIYFYGGEQA